MKLINEETLTVRLLTDEQVAKLKEAIDAGNVTDEFGEVLVWDDITDIDGDIVLEEGGFENCLEAIK